MNTRKQVLIMSGLLLLMLVIVGIYAAWYPYRAEDAESHFEEATAERGSILFARNCRLCHGDLAEGGSLGGRLPAAPALNRPDLQGFEDSDAELTAEAGLATDTLEVSDGAALVVGDIILIGEERMEVTAIDGNTVTVNRAVEHTEAAGHFPGATIYAFDEAVLDEKIELITNTIVCGRVGTAMPAWAQEQGGPLSEEQIRQLTVLITTARWDLVEHEIAIEDAISSALTAPVAPDATEISVTDITRFNEGEAIRIGDERLRITGIPEFPANATGVPGTLTVERAIHSTFAAQHPQETEIFRFPEVAEPATNEQSCGQIAQAPAPQGTPELIEEFDGDQTVEVAAVNIAFDTDEITIQSDGEVRVRFTNRDPATPHNIAFYTDDSASEPVSEGSVGITFDGTAEGVPDDTVFAIPDAGEYFFRCDVHPTIMTGTFIVE
jgi:plastocyanin